MHRPVQRKYVTNMTHGPRVDSNRVELYGIDQKEPKGLLK